MKLQSSILAVAATMSFGFLADANAQYRPDSHYRPNPSSNLIRQAQVVDHLANQLRNEFRGYYNGSPNFRHLSSDVVAISSRARTIQSLARQHSPSYGQLNREVSELASLNVHVQGLVRDAQRGRYGASRHSNVQQILRSLNNSINSLRAEVASLQRASQHRGHGHGPTYNDRDRGPAAPPFPHQGGRR